MIPLATKFRARGFNWRILQREGDVAIVEQNKEGWREPVLNVVIVQRHKERVIGGNTVPAREGLPGWEQWGDAASTCGCKVEAKHRFNALVDSLPAAVEASEGCAPSQIPTKSS